MNRRVGRIGLGTARSSMARMALATTAMAALVAAAAQWPIWDAGPVLSAAVLALVVAGGAGAYLAVCRCLGLSEASRLLRAVGRKIRPGA